MADIERWITVNGTHIPIIKGESRTRAVANFIKSKRAGKGRNVKGYSTDPYNRVKKATDAADETYKIFNERVNNASERLDEFRKERRERLNKLDDQLYKKYPNYLKDELNYRKYHGERDMARRKADYEEARLRGIVDSESTLRDLESGYAYMDELNKGYSGYKLKAGKETPAKRTIKGAGKTAGMKAADEKYYKARERADDKVRTALRTPAPVYEHDAAWEKYQKAYKAAAKKRTKAYTYKMTDDNRRKMINDLGSKVTKLDRQVENAKTTSEFRRLQNKEGRTQKAINTFGGKYIVGRKKKK